VDLIVVGASFAGLACAHSAATLGLDTLVVERKPAAGHRPHTTGLLVHEVGDELDVPRRLVRRVPGVRLYSPGLRFVDLEHPGYHFLATDLPALLQWLAERARGAGARLVFDTPFRGGVESAERVALAGTGWRTRLLVGADGPRSPVARAFGLGANRRFLFGVEVELEGVTGIDPDHLHVFLDAELAPGYIGWAVPGVGITQVGLAGAGGGRPRLPEFLAKVGRIFDLSAARVVAHRAGPIPVGGLVHPLGTDRVVLVGDAAGQVSPLTAGGIHNALHFGRLAGRAAAAHLLDGAPPPAQALAGELPTFAWKGSLRSMFESVGSNRLIEAVAFSRPVLSAARLVFFHHRGLLTAAGWRELTASPRAAPLDAAG
jgi:flavin-dependent dehydrogenase